MAPSKDSAPSRWLAEHSAWQLCVETEENLDDHKLTLSQGMKKKILKAVSGMFPILFIYFFHSVEIIAKIFSFYFMHFIK